MGGGGGRITRLAVLKGIGDLYIQIKNVNR